MPEMEPMDFDRRLRSMLEDAEAKPSRRVWKGVSSRLDAADAAASASWAWVKWAVTGLAAAAAVVAGIFTHDPIPTYYNIQQEEPSSITAQVVPEARQEQTYQEAQPNGQADAPVAGPAQKAVKRKVAEESVQIVRSERQELTAQAFIPDEPQSNGDRQEMQEDPEQDAQVQEQVQDDPFARMAWEDAHENPASPTQIYVSGTLTGNESGISARWDNRHYSSSADIPKTGVTELGDSSYGIPFTIGLGTRFYVAPRLSIGTGLDYSLVTRSFEGKYNNVNGGVIEQTASGTFFHSMHYIGIPVNVYYDLIAGDKLKFYIYGGGAGEYCIANKYTLYSENITYTEHVRKLQWSAGAGLGVEFKLTPFLGIYVDPGVRYFFDCQQPKNVRTEHPLLMDFNAGVRFGF